MPIASVLDRYPFNEFDTSILLLGILHLSKPFIEARKSSLEEMVNQIEISHV